MLPLRIVPVKQVPVVYRRGILWAPSFKRRYSTALFDSQCPPAHFVDLKKFYQSATEYDIVFNHFEEHLHKKFLRVVKSGNTQESFISGTSATYVEDMYNAWRSDEKSVHPSWASYFKQTTQGAAPGQAHSRVPVLSASAVTVTHGGGGTTAAMPAASPTMSSASPTMAAGSPMQATTGNIPTDVMMATINLIRRYQQGGHLLADLDPLKISLLSHASESYVEDSKMTYEEQLKTVHDNVIRSFYLPVSPNLDWDRVLPLPIHTWIGGDQKELSLREIVKRLQQSYSNHIGIEYTHLTNPEQVYWLREQIETPNRVYQRTESQKKRLLERLIRANHLEMYLAKKWPGEKRFGLEGCETLVPALKEVIDVASMLGGEKFIIGMAHRGRLNVLANVCRKPLENIFAEFAGLALADVGSGDVKYHLGTQVKRMNRVTGKETTIVLVANPSHLEAVAPVVEGRTRAEQFYLKDKPGNKVMAIIMHGDASFSGQGVCFESMNMTNLPCYTNHGTVHIVVNNQVGFTTDPRYSRSSPYCTDLGKVVNAPVFHVNADDPEAAMFASDVAIEFRYKFKQDVIIDIVGYRRNGHNETDEPMFTQPLMYTKIKALKPVHEQYAEKLINEKVVTKEFVDEYAAHYLEVCEESYNNARKTQQVNLADWLDSPWPGFFKDKDPFHCPQTGVPIDVLQHIGEVVSTPPPEDFVIHRGITRILNARMDLVKAGQVDWALGECLAFGSLLLQGVHVRLSGQDVERGTFSHRHHVLHHQKKDLTTFIPLQRLSPNQGQYTVCNSSLSEFGVLGFETGYSMAKPDSLVMWEAQFGDFSNTAQCIIDQFLSSGQSKWVRQCGLVLLLPHGMEGQGPEHSSARLERFLQMCSDDVESVTPEMREGSSTETVRQLSEINWIIVSPTTPANMFHVLRRQIVLPFRKPLVVMSPKSLLRHPEARSMISEMEDGTEFKRIIPAYGACEAAPEGVKRIVFCSGKVFYDAKKEIENANRSAEFALVRIEQICPFPYDLVVEERNKYPNADIVWLQEEHKNQGGWTYVGPRIRAALQEEAKYVGRPSSSSPATGNKVVYKKEYEGFVTDMLSV